VSFKPKDMEEASGRYGKIQMAPDNRLYWPGSGSWLVAYYPPKKIVEVLNNAVSGKPVERIFVNKDLEKPLGAAMEDLLCSGTFSELKTFDGCYNVRYERGSLGKLSTHSYALALDFNAKLNPMGGKSDWSDAFIRCFTDNGFIWGGEWKRADAMHFQWCGISKQIISLAS